MPHYCTTLSCNFSLQLFSLQKNILKSCILCCSLWFLYLIPVTGCSSPCVFPSRYSVTRPVETHMSGSSKNLASQAKVSVVLYLSLLKLAKFLVSRYGISSGKLFCCSQSLMQSSPVLWSQGKAHFPKESTRLCKDVLASTLISENRKLALQISHLSNLAGKASCAESINSSNHFQYQAGDYWFSAQSVPGTTGKCVYIPLKDMYGISKLLAAPSPR